MHFPCLKSGRFPRDYSVGSETRNDRCHQILKSIGNGLNMLP
jgi:hypothetical protein